MAVPVPWYYIVAPICGAYYLMMFVLIFRFFEWRVQNWNKCHGGGGKVNPELALNDRLEKTKKEIKRSLTVFDKAPQTKVNAFVNGRANFPRSQQLMYALIGPFSIPFRLSTAIGAIVVALIFANIGTIGLDTKAILRGEIKKPFGGFRKLMRFPIQIAARVLLFSLGIIWVHTKGTRASRKKAPLMIANHRSFIDPFYLVSQNGCCPVSAASNLKTPGFGDMLKLFQPINVDREAKSNTAVADMIKSRATSQGVWPQTILFPEGTTTNGKALVYFKVGAFTPGVPVQPVLVTYPNVFTDISWVDGGSPGLGGGPGLGETLLKLLCCTWLSMSVEYLPPYIPSDAEKADAKLYAHNVREVMAQHLQVPVSEESFDDCILMMKAAALHLPPEVAELNLRGVRNVFDLNVDDAKAMLEKFAKSEHDVNGHIHEDGFVKMFPEAKDEKIVRKLFTLLDKEGHGWVDFREYVLGVSLLNGSDKSGMDSALRLCFRCFDEGGKGALNFEELTKVLRMGFPNLKLEQAKVMFDEADADKDGKVSIDDFLHFCHEHESVLPKFRDKIFGAESIHQQIKAETKKGAE